jgi:presqualene diphosphate synthase
MVTLDRIEGLGLVSVRDATAATSRDEDAAINQRVGAAAIPFSWLMRLLPVSRRKAMQALCAFGSEVGGIVDGKASWTMKLALLADWRAEIALLYAGRPEHIVTRALRDPVDRFDLLCEDFLALINGKEMDVRDIRAPSLQYLDLYCEQRAVAVSRIALRILGVPPPDGVRLAAPLGRGMQLTGILRDLAQDAARQRLYLPRELLCAHGIFATMPSYVLAQPALPQVCNALAERAAAYFADAERAMVTRPRLAMLAATAMLSGYRTLLDALLSRGWTRLDEPVRTPVWHQTALLTGRSLIGR